MVVWRRLYQRVLNFMEALTDDDGDDDDDDDDNHWKL